MSVYKRPLLVAAEVIAVLLIAVNAVVAAHGATSTTHLSDFGSFIASGRAAAKGLNPYAIDPLDYQGGVGTAAERLVSPNLNPPISLPLFELFARFSLAQARTGEALLSAALYVLTLLLLVRAGGEPIPWRRLLWAGALAGFWATLQLGQIYAPLLLAVTGAWLCLQRRRWLAAGLLIGLVATVKPQFLLWPALLLLGGMPLPALAAAATALTLSLLPILRYGPGIYGQWLHVQAGQIGIDLPHNASLVAIATRAGAPWLGYVAAVALLAALALVVRRRRPSAQAVSALALVGALLVSPVSWISYTVLLVPVLISRPWNAGLRAGALLLLVPQVSFWWAVALPRPMFVLAGSLYGWSLLLIFVSLFREAWGPTSLPASPPRGERSEREDLTPGPVFYATPMAAAREGEAIGIW